MEIAIAIFAEAFANDSAIGSGGDRVTRNFRISEYGRGTGFDRFEAGGKELRSNKAARDRD